MKKVLIINTIGFGYEGISNVILNYCRFMNKDGIELHIVCYSDTAESVVSIAKENAIVHRIISRKKKCIKYLKDLNALLRVGFDTIHINGNSATMCLETLLAKGHGINNIIVHGHSTSTNHPVINRLLRPLLINTSDVRLACTLGTAAMYLNGSWLPNEVKEMAGPDFHWGCFAYPALTDGANGIETNNFGAQVFGINKDTKLAKEAFDLITFLTKGEYDQKLADETVGIPADTTNTEWPAMVECAKPVIEQSTNRFTWACGVESNVDMTPVIKENFIKLMAGSITADEFVSTMQDAAK